MDMRNLHASQVARCAERVSRAEDRLSAARVLARDARSAVESFEAGRIRDLMGGEQVREAPRSAEVLATKRDAVAYADMLVERFEAEVEKVSETLRQAREDQASYAARVTGHPEAA